MCLLAIRHVHSRRIVHRDIKAANVFLTKAGVVKLGDFGVSTFLEAALAQRSARGRLGRPTICRRRSSTPELRAEERRLVPRRPAVRSLRSLRPFEARSMVALCRLVTAKRTPSPSFLLRRRRRKARPLAHDAGPGPAALGGRRPPRLRLRPVPHRAGRGCDLGQLQIDLGRFPLVSVIFRRAIISRCGLEACMLFSWNARARNTQVEAT